MKRVVSAIFPFLGFLVFFAGGLRLQHQIIQKEGARAERYYDLLYLPSSKYVQFAAVGYDHFLADFFFLRVIQTFGASYANSVNLGQLWAYFNSITDLDPHFIAAYSFGNLVIGEEGNDTERGLALLDKGIEENPQTYRLAFEAAFFSLWTLNEPERARTYVHLAEKAPDAPDFISRWEGFIDEQMGRYHAAFQQFLREYLKAINANEPTLMSLNEGRLKSALDEWYKAVLLEKAIEFYDKEGFYPLVEELEADGAFLDVEWPDWNALSAFLNQVLVSEQPIDDSEEGVQQLADRFTRTGWLKMPDNPSGHPVFRGYILWPGQEPKTASGRDNPIFLGSELNVAFSVKDSIVSAAYRIQAYRDANDGECPPDLASVSPTLLALQEPWGGEFILDTELCYIYPSTYPELGEMLLGYRRL